LEARRGDVQVHRVSCRGPRPPRSADCPRVRRHRGLPRHWVDFRFGRPRRILGHDRDWKRCLRCRFSLHFSNIPQTARGGSALWFRVESIVGSIPGDVPKLSLIHYLKSVLKGMIAIGPMTTYRSDISAETALLTLVGLSAALIVLTMMVFQQMEFRQKASVVAPCVVSRSMLN